MTQEEYEMTCFQMITAAGTAKSDYIEALRAAKTGDYAKAEELLASGLESYNAGHEAHSAMVQQEAAGNPVTPTLLMTHVEDQMMSAEVIRTMVIELIDVYKKLENKEN
ncbi:PTS lactose/cellobiose transporter subunit IIA [Bifidobacterium callitrichos]|nr:PTS lactose/cellobiose transporter subunit IIA [Bifidobacterium callitrichos]